MILVNGKPATSTQTALTMQAVSSTEAVLPFLNHEDGVTRPLQQLHIYQTARHHNPEDSNRVAHCCEDPKSRRNEEFPLVPTFLKHKNIKSKAHRGRKMVPPSVK